MKRIYFVFAIGLILSMLLSACSSEPANRLEAIKKAGKMVVGTSADYPPYESKDEAGEFVGFDMDLMREIGKGLGVDIEFQDMAFDTLIAGVQEGKIDAVIAAMQASPAREETVDFSNPYHFQVDAFLVAGDSDIVMEKPQDAAGLTIGVQTGTVQEDWVLANLVPLGTTEDQIFRYERIDQGALDVQNGRIDVLFINASPAAELAEIQGLKIALATSETVAAGQAIAMMQGETALKAEIDRILAELEANGTIRKLLDQYGIP